MLPEIRNRNEILQGPSPACFQVLHEAEVGDLSCYFPGYFGSELVPVLSRTLGIDEKHIIVSQGAEGILRTVFDRVEGEGGSVLWNTLHFPYYDTYCTHRGIRFGTFGNLEGEVRFRFDWEDFARQVKALQPRVILLGSPNNPTGQSISRGELESIVMSVAKTTLVMVDEAYYGFARDPDPSWYPEILTKHPNLAFIRTFSKYYALAGMRVGFALCGENVLAALSYQRPYLGGNPLVERVAIAALSDQDYYRNLATGITTLRDRAISTLNISRSFRAYASNASFFLFKAAQDVLPTIIDLVGHSSPTIARHVNGPYFRVSVSLASDMESFLGALAMIDMDDHVWIAEKRDDPSTITA